MSTKKNNPKTRNSLIQSRVNAGELQEIFTKATLYNGGNVSDFVRDAAINYKPIKRVKK